MIKKYHEESAEYCVIRYINEDLNTTVSRFAEYYHRVPSTIINWQGRGKDKKNVRRLWDLPIWILTLFALSSNTSEQEVLKKLQGYESDWLADNSYYFLRDGQIQPKQIWDFVSLELGQPFHDDGYAGKTRYLWFDKFILAYFSSNDEWDFENNPSLVVYANDDKTEKLFSMDLTNNTNGEKATAHEIVEKIKTLGLA